MNSLAKMLEVLALFTPLEPTLSVEEIVARLGYSRPTGYRYVRELCAAGLLRRYAKGYSLGQRIIELDYIIRQSDPLLQVAAGTMRGLADRYGCEVVLLSMYGHKVVTVHEEKGTGAPPVGFGRGRPIPLFRGAGSKVFTAFLPPAKQKKLFTSFPEEAADSQLGSDWPTFRASLRKIRSAGSAISVGELESANVGVAAPVMGEDGDIASALVLILTKARYQISDKPLLLDTLKRAAAHISQRIGGHELLDENGLPIAAEHGRN